MRLEGSNERPGNSQLPCFLLVSISEGSSQAHTLFRANFLTAVVYSWNSNLGNSSLPVSLAFLMVSTPLPCPGILQKPWLREENVSLNADKF